MVKAAHYHGQTGVIHIEGLLVHGGSILDGIAIDASSATAVQIAACRIETRVATEDEIDPAALATKAINVYGSNELLEVRMERCTIVTDKYGICVLPEIGSMPALIELSKVNVDGARFTHGGVPTATHLISFAGPGGENTRAVFDDAWANPGAPDFVDSFKVQVGTPQGPPNRWSIGEGLAE
jgi:hypothetical protein